MLSVGATIAADPFFGWLGGAGLVAAAGGAGLVALGWGWGVAGVGFQLGAMRAFWAWTRRAGEVEEKTMGEVALSRMDFTWATVALG